MPQDRVALTPNVAPCDATFFDERTLFIFAPYRETTRVVAAGMWACTSCAP